MIITVDTEGNNLRPEADKMWCACAIDDDGCMYRFYDGPEIENQYQDYPLIIDQSLEKLLILLDEADEICMHNGIDYDKWLINKIFGYEIPLNKIIDTLVLSRHLDPQRKSPDGWTGKPAPHSVEAWGMRFGVHKKEHEDWSQFSPEMLIRCESDVIIQQKILKYLLEEANE